MPSLHLQAGCMSTQVDRKTQLLWPLVDPKNHPVKLAAAAFFAQKLFWFADKHPDLNIIVTAEALTQEGLEPAYYAPMFAAAPKGFAVPEAWHERFPPPRQSKRIIVSANKDYDLKDDFAKRMEALLSKLDLSDVEIVYGDERGVGGIAEEWASTHNIMTRQFDAAWNDLDAPGAFIKTGKSASYNTNAGADRNALLGLYGTHLVVLSEQPGAAVQSMIDTATKHQLIMRGVK